MVDTITTTAQGQTVATPPVTQNPEDIKLQYFAGAYRSIALKLRMPGEAERTNEDIVALLKNPNVATEYGLQNIKTNGIVVEQILKISQKITLALQNAAVEPFKALMARHIVGDGAQQVSNYNLVDHLVTNPPNNLDNIIAQANQIAAAQQQAAQTQVQAAATPPVEEIKAAPAPVAEKPAEGKAEAVVAKPVQVALQNLTLAFVDGHLGLVDTNTGNVVAGINLSTPDTNKIAPKPGEPAVVKPVEPGLPAQATAIGPGIAIDPVRGAFVPAGAVGFTQMLAEPQKPAGPVSLTDRVAQPAPKFIDGAAARTNAPNSMARA